MQCTFEFCDSGSYVTLLQSDNISFPQTAPLDSASLTSSVLSNSFSTECSTTVTADYLLWRQWCLSISTCWMVLRHTGVTFLQYSLKGHTQSRKRSIFLIAYGLSQHSMAAEREWCVLVLILQIWGDFTHYLELKRNSKSEYICGKHDIWRKDTQ